MSLNLTEGEAFDEVSSIICNLESVKGIESVLDIGLLEEHILKDLRKDSFQKKKI